jgi:RNA polymerase sigma-70 factor (ECF subfamily)
MFAWQRSTKTEFSEPGERLPAFEHMLARAKKGESEGITALYHHFLPGIFGYIAARVPDRCIAEDLTSEVFLKMVEGIARVRTQEEAGIAAWLFQVARITIAGYYRQQEKQPDCVYLEPANEEGDAETWENYVTPVNHPDTDPVRRSESREEWNTVVQAMNCLTEEQRQVLVGRLILGYDVATVARMIGKQANAVKALQFRALQSLNRILKKNMQPERERTGTVGPSGDAAGVVPCADPVPTRSRRDREDAR